MALWPPRSKAASRSRRCSGVSAFLDPIEAEDSADDGKFSLGFRVTFDRSHAPTKLKVTCRVSKITTDEPRGAR